jgi:hypothetical protein
MSRGMKGEVLGPPVGYVDLLDLATTEHLEREDKAGRTYTPIRPSASGKCTRELYYELQEYHKLARYEKRPKTPATKRLLDLGHSVEWHVLKQMDLIKDMFSVRYKQQMLSFKYFEAKNNPAYSQWLEGSLDLVLWSEKHKCVADVKSKKDGYDFKARKMKWDVMNDQLDEMPSVERIGANSFWVENLADFLRELNDPFFEANFLQLNLYANSQFLRERGIDHGAVLQYNKNDSRMREVRFKSSREVYEQVLAKFDRAFRALDEGNDALATRDYQDGSFKCRFCDFQNVCWGKKGKKK